MIYKVSRKIYQYNYINKIIISIYTHYDKHSRYKISKVEIDI